MRVTKTAIGGLVKDTGEKMVECVNCKREVPESEAVMTPGQEIVICHYCNDRD